MKLKYDNLWIYNPYLLLCLQGIYPFWKLNFSNFYNSVFQNSYQLGKIEDNVIIN